MTSCGEDCAMPITDAQRFRWLLAKPETARHLFTLLSQKKVDQTYIVQTIDNIITSQQAARRPL